MREHGLYWIPKAARTSYPFISTALFFIFFLITLSNIDAQPHKANTTTLNNKTGLSGLSVKSIHIDQSAHIWIETENSLERWNGYHFEKMNAPSYDESIGPRRPAKIETFAEDDQFIYVFYRFERSHYDVYDKQTRRFTKKSFGEKDEISWLAAATNKNGNPCLLFESDTMLHFIELPDQSIKTYGLNNLTPSAISDFSIGHNGFYVRDSSQTIGYFPFNGNARHYEVKAPSPTLGIGQLTTAFHIDKEDRLWFSMPDRAGLFTITPGSNTVSKIDDIPTDQLIVNLWADKKGRKLIGLSSVFQIVREYLVSNNDKDFHPWNFLSNQSVIPTQVVSDDFYQRIHFATHQDLDIISFQAPYIQSSLIKPNIPSDQYGNIITSIIELPNKDILCNTEENEAFVYNPQSRSAMYSKNPDSDVIGQFPTLSTSKKTLHSFFKTQDYYSSEFSNLDLQSGRHRGIYLPMHSTGITALLDDRLLLYGAMEKGSRIYIYDAKEQHIDTLDDDAYPELLGSNINHVYFNEKLNHIYFCTYDQGLFVAKWNDSKLSSVKKIRPSDFPTNNIISVRSNKKGDLFVGSYTGLYILNEADFSIKFQYGIEEGLSSNIVTAAVEDEFGRYWVSTFAGLNMISKDRKRIGQFYLTDGLPHEEFNRNVVLHTTDDAIYFGSGNGLTIISPETYEQYDAPFNIQYSHANIRTQNQDIHIDTIPTHPIELTFGEVSGIDLFVGNNDWGLTDEVNYLFRIDKLDKEWQKTHEEKLVIERLPEGRYNIEAKALSIHGRLSSNTLTIPVRVVIPFFERTWVRILSSLLVLFLLGLIYLLLERRRNKQALSFQKRVSDLELSLLQSQMNPHFIFNALGAIQFYIYNNDSKIAEEYLSKFATLMRMFLESSRHKFVTLADEIKLLKGYVELEHMRFPDKFESKVETNLTESSDLYLVPSMLLQPFVENAINHGLFHKEEFGHLQLSFHDEGEVLVCAIDDDGIGRDAAKEIRASSLKQHKSRASQITEERIEVLKEAKEMDIQITYQDYDIKQDGRSGTRVEIRIPTL